ncbi:beta-propeller fold lactonase family protein [uncultured Bifidobacterium sp.]|uniref:lactonase family protein n=1 Tax=uncultured Bifidobacterium sp. TaxID=165187 RepID=UPI0026132BFD|nr:beta-propeller fold lactonase family protein [uncultured Bifidobacterium sp.]
MSYEEKRVGVDLLVGGFGALNGQSCPGVGWVALDEGDDGAVTVRYRDVLEDVPSPTWLASLGSVVVAVLENTGELASLSVSRRDGYPVTSRLSRVKVPGEGPTHAALMRDDRGGVKVVVADYGDGTIAVHGLDASGRLTAATQSIPASPGLHGPLPAQRGPHAHWVLPLPDGRVLTTDLGADRIHVHRWRDGILVREASLVLPPGTGPRDMHLLPLADGGWRVAVVGEWGCDVTILDMSCVDGAPALDSADRPEANPSDAGERAARRSQCISLPAAAGDQAASLAFVPDPTWRVESAGRRGTSSTLGSDGMVYVGLRGSDRIVALRWSDGRLSVIQPSSRGISTPLTAEMDVREVDAREMDAQGKVMRKRAPQNGVAAEPDGLWRENGVSSGGGRPRQILAYGRLLVVSNETADHLDVFRIDNDGRPVWCGGAHVASPTVALPI